MILEPLQIQIEDVAIPYILAALGILAGMYYAKKYYNKGTKDIIENHIRKSKNLVNGIGSIYIEIHRITYTIEDDSEYYEGERTADISAKLGTYLQENKKLIESLIDRSNTQMIELNGLSKNNSIDIMKMHLSDCLKLLIWLKECYVDNLNTDNNEDDIISIDDKNIEPSSYKSSSWNEHYETFMENKDKVLGIIVNIDDV